MQQSYVSDPFETGVDIREYLYLLWSWAWVIVLAGLTAGAAAYFISSRQVPIYETTTRLLVSDPPAISTVDSKSMLNTSTMPNTYSEMVMDSPVLQGVIDALELKIPLDELKKNVSVELINQTQLLVVTVKDTNADLAADIANTIARVFAERVRELQSERYATSKEGLQRQVTEMGTQIEKTTRELEITTNEASKQQLEARLTEYTRLYSDLVLNYEKVRLSEAQTSTNVVVTEPAAPNYIPVSPRTMQNTLLAVVVGMLLAAGTIFAVDMLDDSIKNPEEVRKNFNLPVLGVIARHEVTEGKPICEAEPRSPVAESFRALRTNINFASVDKPLRKIVITSPTPQDGKTTVASNLAVVLAQGEKTVALVDADLRRPQVHHRFGLMNRLGLSDLFVKPDDAITDALQQTSSPRLAVMTSGSLPPNPSELLTSQRMAKIMEILLHGFNMIVIDTPPLLTVTDAAAMAQSVDGVILVAKPGSTKMSALRQSLEALQAVNANILGVVLNEVNPASRRYGYYYHKYYAKGKYYYAGEGKRE